MGQQLLDVGFKIADHDRVREELVARVVGIGDHAGQGALAAVIAVELDKIMVATPVVEPVVGKRNNQADVMHMGLVNSIVNGGKSFQVETFASGLEGKSL